MLLLLLEVQSLFLCGADSHVFLLLPTPRSQWSLSLASLSGLWSLLTAPLLCLSLLSSPLEPPALRRGPEKITQQVPGLNVAALAAS